MLDLGIDSSITHDNKTAIDMIFLIPANLNAVMQIIFPLIDHSAFIESIGAVLDKYLHLDAAGRLLHEREIIQELLDNVVYPEVAYQ